MPDLILFNAKVITMDPALPRAGSMVVREGVIADVAANDRLAFPTNEHTRTIDCRGATIVPGFIDAHCHVRAYAESLVTIDLSPRERVNSIPEMVERIRDFSTGHLPGSWIRGRGYDEFYLVERRHPNRLDLDAATSLHPVKLTHRSGHAHVLNTLALRRVGIDTETGDPPEGLIDRDLLTGEPTGILYGMGGFLARRIPPLDGTEIERGLALANERLLSYGVTSVQDASSHNGPTEWKEFERWKTRGLFAPRVTLMTGTKSFAESRDRSWAPSRVERNDLVLGGVKIMVDRTTGSIRPSRERLDEMVLAIHAAGLQVSIHAVEETAIEAAVNAIEYALRRLPRRDHRHRIEHCSVCPPPLLARLRDLGIAVVTQPAFIYYSGDRYLETVSESERPYLYPVGSMLKSRLLVGFGSDAPVVDPNPLMGIRSAVTRTSEGGKALLAGEGVGPMEALRAYTSGAAEVTFEEGTKGSVSPGKLADLTVLSGNPLTIDAGGIKDIRVEMTVLGGEVVWSRDGFGR